MSRSATIVIASICALIALSVALALTSGATQHGAAGPGQWRVIGPGGGGAQFFPAVSPHDSSTVLVACDMAGAYITHDGGRSWRMFNLRAPARFFAFDPLAQKSPFRQGQALAGVVRVSARGCISAVPRCRSPCHSSIPRRGDRVDS